MFFGDSQHEREHLLYACVCVCVRTCVLCVCCVCVLCVCNMIPGLSIAGGVFCSLGEGQVDTVVHY